MRQNAFLKIEDGKPYLLSLEEAIKENPSCRTMKFKHFVPAASGDIFVRLVQQYNKKELEIIDNPPSMDNITVEQMENILNQLYFHKVFEIIRKCVGIKVNLDGYMVVTDYYDTPKDPISIDINTPEDIKKYAKKIADFYNQYQRYATIHIGFNYEGNKKHTYVLANKNHLTHGIRIRNGVLKTFGLDEKVKFDSKLENTIRILKTKYKK